MTRVRAYVRESTVEQGTKFGPDAQRTAILQACVDLEVAAPTHWYTDLVSGTGKVVRDELRQAIAAAAAGEYDVLVLYDTSRFARNTRDALNFEAELARAGVRVYYAAERIWADDDAKALHKEMVHVINAEYSRALGRRIRDGYAAKFARLGVPGGTLPWGYRWTDATATAIAFIDEEAALRRELLELYATGHYSALTLSDELNRRGRAVRGKALDATVVYEVLKNPIAIGVTRRKGIARDDVAPALIERGTWDTIQRLMRERRGRRGTPAQRARYLFTSRARHDVCGRPLWGHSSSRPSGALVNRLQHSRPTCGVGFQRTEAVLEAELIAWLETWRLDRTHEARLRKFLAQPAAAGRDPDVERRAAQARLERARRLYLLGDLDDQAYDAEKRAARAVLDELVSLAAPTVRDAGKLLSIPAAWPRMPLEKRRAVLEHLTTEIRFGARETELVIRPELRRLIGAIAAPALWRGVGSVDSAGFEPATPRM